MADRRHGRLREPSADGITKSTVCTTAFAHRATAAPTVAPATAAAPSAIASRWREHQALEVVGAARALERQRQSD